MTSIFNYVCILTILSVNTTFSVISGVSIEAPYYFGYNSTRGTMTATISIYNNFSSSMTVYLVKYTQKPGFKIKGKFNELIKAGDKFIYEYESELEYNVISFGLEFANCSEPLKIIFEGKAIDHYNADPEYKYDDKCLRSQPCQIHMYLQDKCSDAPSVTTEKPQTGLETLVIVLSSLLSIVFIVLVVIVIWICWNKQSPQGTRGVQPNHNDRFYLNMLFRRECDQEIAELERHHYEEIDPGPVAGSQNVR